MKMKILIVDDSASIRTTMSMLLSHLGHEPHIAANALEGLDVLQSHANFERVITDLEMPPGMDGIEFTRRAKVLYPKLPVIMLSGSITPEIEKTALAAGVTACLRKPFGVQQIAKIIAA